MLELDYLHVPLFPGKMAKRCGRRKKRKVTPFFILLSEIRVRYPQLSVVEVRFFSDLF